MLHIKDIDTTLILIDMDMFLECSTGTAFKEGLFISPLRVPKLEGS